MANRIDAVVEIIKSQREASRLCSEMARDTADNAESAASFASDGEDIDDAYKSALESIEGGNWAEALDELRGAQQLERDGGDDQHATRSIEALQGMLSESTAT